MPLVEARGRGRGRARPSPSPSRPRRSASSGGPSSATGRATGELDEAGIAAELAERRAADVARGYTVWGPHRDEVELQPRRPRRCAATDRRASSGLALLALLFAEREALRAARRTLPLMLLDDVMSELDPDRRGRLVEAIAAGGQVLITATEAEHVPERRPAPPRGGGSRVRAARGRRRSAA